MKEYYSANGVTFYAGDVRAVWDALPTGSVQCVVTSPPYFGLRDYNVAGQIGQEPMVDAYVQTLVAVFRSVRRVLRPDGTCWINIADSYSNDSKWGGATGGKHVAGLHGQTGIGRQKRVTGLGDGQLLMIPARVAIALQDDGWVLRNELIGAKTAPMPESVGDRFTRAHEQIYVFAARRRYFMDMAAIKEPAVKGAAGSRFTAGKTGVNGQGRVSELPREDATTRNPRDWFLWAPEPTSVAHYAAFPSAIPRLAILAGTSAAGACPACGTAWRRVVERERAGRSIVNARSAQNDPSLPHGLRVDPTRRLGRDIADATVTVGWQPACRCNAGAPQPCVVGDPFVGSDTTARVAYSLGRAFVGGDLNSDYLDLAIAGMRDVTPWYAATPDPATDLAGLPLFAQVPA
jgi:DNA modification methylase